MFCALRWAHQGSPLASALNVSTLHLGTPPPRPPAAREPSVSKSLTPHPSIFTLLIFWPIFQIFFFFFPFLLWLETGEEEREKGKKEITIACFKIFLLLSIQMGFSLIGFDAHCKGKLS